MFYQANKFKSAGWIFAGLFVFSLLNLGNGVLAVPGENENATFREISDPEWGKPPAKDETSQKVPNYTFIEQQFRFASEKEFQQLKMSRDFIRKLEHLAPRSEAPGYWIDRVQATKPPFKDITPQLDPETLYCEKQAVRDHWPAFRERYPKMVHELEEWGYEPSLELLGMPEQDFKGFVENWDDEFGKGRNSGHALGDCLLYVDYLAAHGSRMDKWNACKLLVEATAFVSSSLDDHAKTKKFSYAFAREFLWPLLAPDNGTYWIGFYEYVPGSIRREIESSDEGSNYLLDKDYIRARKWIRWNVPLTPDRRMAEASLWSNVYSASKDYIGVFLCLHAGHLDRRMDKTTMDYMRKSLVRHFGKPKGDRLFLEYLSTYPKKENSRIDEYRQRLRSSLDK